MKRIYFQTSWKPHSIHREMALNPPEGYEFTTFSPLKETIGAASRTKALSFLIANIGRRVPLNLIRARLQSLEKIPPDVDLIYSCGLLVYRKKAWVVDYEFIPLLIGYDLNLLKRYRGAIERAFASQYCKKIICWTESAKRSALWNLDCSEFGHKLELVPFAVPKKDFTKSYNNQKVKLLFVGSANLLNEFELKGGGEVLEAFMSLNSKYDNLELVVRSDLRQDIKDKYQGVENLRIIDKEIPWQLLEQEFKSADIFLFPSYNTPYQVFLDAMSYELPIITTDVSTNPELVADGEIGFTIKKSDRVTYYGERFLSALNIPPTQHSRSTDPRKAEEFFMLNLGTPQIDKVIRTPDPKVVNELVEKASILIENEELRRGMGRAGRWEIEQGKFSIPKRNEKLKRIFDEATA